ncbi:mannonate dehydratase [Litorilinea aerophila]|uniref:mannonate dehydratase n=1 Tax=Litorilinea aerophila TaxID=1204385 RepID=A0A540VJJ7_9CHLR|nr:mannonate dehydratase [Litorilinea aerophila]MCC9075419.1 mannonate dehydratase [Litorilinea aerophila]GIV78644.1 MAG: mannonate dehydratase [Litorilinea sp.]
MYIQDTMRWTDLDDDRLRFYRALSVDMIQLDIRSGVSTVDSPLGQALRAGRDCTADFEQARERVEAHGMQLNAVVMSCWPEITLGRPDMDEKIEAWCRMLESLGRAGIPHLGWNFKPMGNFRTTSEIGRGGVQYSTFDYDEFMRNRPPQHTPPVSEEEMWARMEKFLRAVIPVAERAGVRMALHPDDPPVPEPLGGVAQICSTLEQFRRIFDLVPSPSHAMIFCQGCMTELLGTGVYDAIVEMASQGKIAWVHFRNVRGRLPHFAEVFIDEGDIDMRRAMELYRDHGFNGPYMLDHTPRFPQADSEQVGRAYANGYIRCLIQTVYGR